MSRRLTGGRGRKIRKPGNYTTVVKAARTLELIDQVRRELIERGVPLDKPRPDPATVKP